MIIVVGFVFGAMLLGMVSPKLDRRVYVGLIFLILCAFVGLYFFRRFL